MTQSQTETETQTQTQTQSQTQTQTKLVLSFCQRHLTFFIIASLTVSLCPGCDGCASFFKRTIRGRLIYICKRNNLCVIDKKLRNKCRACRLNRCFLLGMKIERVQAERGPRDQQKQLRRQVEDSSHKLPYINPTMPLDLSINMDHQRQYIYPYNILYIPIIIDQFPYIQMCPFWFNSTQ